MFLGGGWDQTEGKGRGSFPHPHSPAHPGPAWALPAPLVRARTHGHREQHRDIAAGGGLLCPRPGCHPACHAPPPSSCGVCRNRVPQAGGLSGRSGLSPSLRSRLSWHLQGRPPASSGLRGSLQASLVPACGCSARPPPPSLCGLPLWMSLCPPLLRSTSTGPPCSRMTNDRCKDP